MACWDLNANETGDPEEDTNADGNFDALDCQGPQGDQGTQGDVGPQGNPGLACWDLNANGMGDPEEDANSDGNFDTQDCRGAEGPQGPQGEQGSQGDPGPEGPTGPQGPQGDQGSPGTSKWTDGSGKVTTEANVGIGTTTPGDKLEVNGNVRIDGGVGIDASPFSSLPLHVKTTYSEIARFESSAASKWISLFQGDTRHGLLGDLSGQIHLQSDTGPILFYTNGHNDRMIIASTGNVGIGTSNPASLLHISAGTGGDAELTLEADTYNNDENDNPFISFKQDGNGANAFIGLEGTAGTRSTGTRSNALVIGSEDNDPDVQFATNDEVRMTIRTNGRVGIGTTAPEGKLDILTNSSTNFPHLILHEDEPFEFARLTFRDNSNGFWTLAGRGTGLFGSHADSEFNLFYSNFGNVLTARGNGNVGVRTSSPSFNLHVNGSAGKPGGGSWSNASDARLKDVRGNYARGLEAIDKLNPVYYNYIKGNPINLPSEEEFVGLIAQEVQKVIPEAVGKYEDDYLSVNNDPIIWTMLNAIKELKAENTATKAELDQTKVENVEIKAELENLKSKMVQLQVSVQKPEAVMATMEKSDEKRQANQRVSVSVK